MFGDKICNFLFVEDTALMHPMLFCQYIACVCSCGVANPKQFAPNCSLLIGYFTVGINPT